MKKVIAFTSLAIFSTAASAFDYKITLEGRADFVNGTVKSTTPAGAATTEKFNNFSNGLVRLNLMGNINENLAYRFRYRFLSSGNNPTSGTREVVNKDGTALDYIYVDHKNQWFTTRFGKQNWVDAFGREAYVSGTDLFITSTASSNYKSAFGSDYRYGVSAIMKLADTNVITLAVSNPNQTMTDTTGTEEKNTGLALGAYYNGSFMEKLLQPTLGYTTGKQNGDKDAAAAAQTKDSDNSIWNAGLRSEISGFTIDADYKVVEMENRNAGTNTAAVNLKSETKSIYSMVSYNAGEFTPIAFYINDKFDSEKNADDFKRNAWAIGTHWKPFADINFRYHVMFSNDVKKFDNAAATNAKVTDKRLWIGFKADI